MGSLTMYPAAIIDEFETPEPTLPSVDFAAGSLRTPDKIPTVRPPYIDFEHAQSPNSRVSGPSCAAYK